MCATNALLLTLLTQKPLAPILTKIGIPIQSTGIYRGSRFNPSQPWLWTQSMRNKCESLWEMKGGVIHCVHFRNKVCILALHPCNPCRVVVSDGMYNCHKRLHLKVREGKSSGQ